MSTQWNTVKTKGEEVYQTQKLKELLEQDLTNAWSLSAEGGIYMSTGREKKEAERHQLCSRGPLGLSLVLHWSNRQKECVVHFNLSSAVNWDHAKPRWYYLRCFHLEDSHRRFQDPHKKLRPGTALVSTIWSHHVPGLCFPYSVTHREVPGTQTIQVIEWKL